MSEGWRSTALSILILVLFLSVWQVATQGTGATQAMDPEYAKLMGVTATQGKSAMPGPLDIGAKLVEHLRAPFYDKGPNDKGIGLQILYSLARVAGGYLLAVIVGVEGPSYRPLGAVMAVFDDKRRVGTGVSNSENVKPWEVSRTREEALLPT